MSMTAVQPMPAASATALEADDVSNTPRRSGFAWEAVKTLIAVAVFAAMLLPVAFPSKASPQGRLQQASSEDMAPPAVKAVAKADAQKAVRKPVASN
ncbi:hypothetical protein ABAZ39_33160 (plasmid) [Azospirillum argentinense]|uniref:Transmembrane protein n=1 Tax=Azospirillum argentinense TaxID=2970906 RepID=A0A060DS61_9PROT|nr:hypothetical protein [Azospirillum argentinense]AIB16686.1 hypothetical protein ABAZ39_33160 [Azospirillum argentinense]EZQ02359.1 hypothetical protein ABAZ39_32820 [Azospirillum argentinense]KAA1054045.1 hypothetical protein FH063_002280 [Azospirillum argentinense]MBK3801681.1 hypothetical protein [Azospirillum argentinense]